MTIVITLICKQIVNNDSDIINHRSFMVKFLYQQTEIFGGTYEKIINF